MGKKSKKGRLRLEHDGNSFQTKEKCSIDCSNGPTQVIIVMWSNKQVSFVQINVKSSDSMSRQTIIELHYRNFKIVIIHFQDVLEVVFENGKLMKDFKLDDVRKLASTPEVCP